MNLSFFCENRPLTKETITSFVDILISNANARTGISKKEIKECNKGFYEYLNKWFDKKKTLNVKDDCEAFNKLCLMFKVPVIKNSERNEDKMISGYGKASEIMGNKVDTTYTHKDCLERNSNEMNLDEKTNGPHSTKELFESSQSSQPSTHIDCLNLFNELSSEEKIKFIMEFQNVEIKLTPHEILVFKSC